MSYPLSTSCGEIGKILHIIFNKILPYKTNGMFIEIGANDGKTGSFTYNLASLGWSGINFEPVPHLYELCNNNHKNHKNVINMQIAIGAENGEAEIIDANTLSSMDTDTISLYKNIDQFKSSYINNNNIYKVQVRTLDSILEEYKINSIDLIVLDVEGFEENVLKGYSIENNNASIIIIEIADQHPDFINNKKVMEKFKRLREYFTNNNYSLLVNDIVDNVYIQNDIYRSIDSTFINEIQSFIKFPQYIDK
jgi:FkbM family methyltransferase